MASAEMPSQDELAKSGGGYKDLQYALGRLAYENRVDPNNGKEWAQFLQSNPQAQSIIKDATTRFGATYGQDLGGRGAALYRAAYQRFRGDDVNRQQQAATEKAFNTAEQFQSGLDQRVQDETAALRGSLSAQLAETRGAIKQQQNARGMLYSGQNQKRQGEAENLAAKTYAQGAGDIVSGAQKQSEELFGKAQALKSGQQSAFNAGQDIQNRAAEARRSASEALQGQYAQLLGSGIGKAYGNREPNAP